MDIFQVVGWMLINEMTCRLCITLYIPQAVTRNFLSPICFICHGVCAESSQEHHPTVLLFWPLDRLMPVIMSKISNSFALSKKPSHDPIVTSTIIFPVRTSSPGQDTWRICFTKLLPTWLAASLFNLFLSWAPFNWDCTGWCTVICCLPVTEIIFQHCVYLICWHIEPQHPILTMIFSISDTTSALPDRPDNPDR